MTSAPVATVCPSLFETYVTAGSATVECRGGLAERGDRRGHVVRVEGTGDLEGHHAAHALGLVLGQRGDLLGGAGGDDLAARR